MMKLTHLTKITITFILSVLVGLTSFLYWPNTRLPEGTEADRLVVNKSDRVMELWVGNRLVKTYRISLGKNPVGHKQHQGDGKTPEGLYYINAKNPNSQFHLNLGISYPNNEDRRNSSDPGGDIKIHGLKNGNGFIGKFHRLLDWTNGCIAVTNEEMEELYEAVPIGTAIEINP